MMSNNTIGKTGRLFVQGELIRRGYVVEESNERLTDFVVNGNTKIKVHTRLNQDNFIMAPNAENGSRDLFYVFVQIQDDGKNRFFIVPSLLVAQRCRIGHRLWAEAKEGRNIDSTIRVFFMKENDGYLWEDQWQLLEQ